MVCVCIFRAKLIDSLFIRECILSRQSQCGRHDERQRIEEKKWAKGRCISIGRYCCCLFCVKRPQLKRCSNGKKCILRTRLINDRLYIITTANVYFILLLFVFSYLVEWGANSSEHCSYPIQLLLYLYSRLLGICFKIHYASEKRAYMCESRGKKCANNAYSRAHITRHSHPFTQINSSIWENKNWNAQQQKCLQFKFPFWKFNKCLGFFFCFFIA